MHRVFCMYNMIESCVFSEPLSSVVSTQSAKHRGDNTPTLDQGSIIRPHKYARALGDVALRNTIDSVPVRHGAARGIGGVFSD